jgi:hypothetical protein
VFRYLLRAVLIFGSFTVTAEQPYGPSNRNYTFNNNQQYGATNWYSSPLGVGLAQAGVTIVGGIVNNMSRPDPVVYTQQQQPPIYVGKVQQNVQAQNSTSMAGQGCSMQVVYDQKGNARQVKICE